MTVYMDLLKRAWIYRWRIILSIACMMTASSLNAFSVASLQAIFDRLFGGTKMLSLPPALLKLMGDFPNWLVEYTEGRKMELLTIIAYRPALAVHAAAVADLADSRVAALLKEPTLLTGDAGPYQALVDSAFLRAENLLADTDDTDLSQHIAMLTARMQEQNVRDRRRQVELDLKSADAEGNSARVQELLAQFQELTTELHRLQTVQQSSSSTIS